MPDSRAGTMPPGSLLDARDSGYGTLLRNIAASIEETDPDAAQAALRASVDVEETVAELLLLRQTVKTIKASEVVELYGLRWAKDGHYYAAAEALGIEEPVEIAPEHSDPHGPRHQ